MASLAAAPSEDVLLRVVSASVNTLQLLMRRLAPDASLGGPRGVRPCAGVPARDGGRLGLPLLLPASGHRMCRRCLRPAGYSGPVRSGDGLVCGDGDGLWTA
jgi:hypothetical protein